MESCDTLRESQEFYTQYFYDARKITYDNRERYEIIFHLVESLNLPSSIRVLDVGTGSGSISTFLIGRFKNVVSIDIVFVETIKGMVQTQPQLNFALAALPNLPFEDASFQLTICSEVLEHINRDAQALSIMELARVVDQKGILILSTPNPRSAYEFIRKAGAFIKRGDTSRKGQLVENYITPDSLRNMLRCGFVIEKCMGSFYLFPPLDRLGKKVAFLYRLSGIIHRRGWAKTKGLYQYYVLQRI